ncbi:MAG: hypothetical protein AABX72_00755 [Nanoarchaeota archaeon]
MGFIESLVEPTGIFEDGSLSERFRNDARQKLKFLNSGVGLNRDLKVITLDYENAGQGVETFFQKGKKFDVYQLNIPTNCLNQGPHCHPGGEWAHVLKGSYFDADMQGKIVRHYTEGSTIFYSKGSTHRPLSHEGARVIYIAFDGIAFGKDPEDLARKMVKIGSTQEALEYALAWMIPDKTERQSLLDKIKVK